MQFFEENGAFAFPIFFNLPQIMADKSTRDSRRMEEMPQYHSDAKSDEAYARLDPRDQGNHVERNHSRYPSGSDWAQPKQLRGDTSTEFCLSPRDWMTEHLSPYCGSLQCGWWFPKSSRESIVGEYWSGVLTASGIADIPVSGTVREEQLSQRRHRVPDLLIEEYAEALEDYLTRVQMLDVIV